jgi:HEAT repeat protein
MKRLNVATAVLGLLVALAYLTATSSGSDSEESELEKSTDALLEAGDYERTLTLAEGFTQEHPQKPIRHSLLVRDLAASGQTEKALKAYYRFYKLGGTFSEELLLEIVRSALSHSDIGVQYTAARTLGELGDTSAIPALINALKDDDIGVLQLAAEALAKLGDKGGILALTKALNEDNRWGRNDAARMLGELGDKSAIPILKNALNDGDSMIRMSIGRVVVARALARLGDKSAIPHFYGSYWGR